MSKPLIIALNGPPGSGKTTSSNILAELAPEHGYDPHQIYVSDVLHSAMIDMFDIDSEAWADACTRKNKPTTLLPMGFANIAPRHVTPREALIWLSEDCMKPMFGDGVFGYIIADRIKEKLTDSQNPLFILDIGFSSELEAVIEKHPDILMTLVRIYRKDCTFENDSRSYIYGGDIDIDREDVIFNDMDESDLRFACHRALMSAICAVERRVL